MTKIKRVNSKSGHCAAAACCAILLLCLTVPAYCEQDSTALMLEVTPSQGGYLNIAPGVHSYDRFAEVTLTATPKPGYQFVYWLGNVTDATTGTTTVLLDSPKIVIAVFERSKFEMVGLENDYVSGGEGGGGLVRSGGLSDTSLEQAIGRSRQQNFHPPKKPNNNIPEDVTNDIPNDVPVPDNGKGDIPVPVPEPATITLLFTGFLVLAKRRRNGANTTEKA
jgi:hypothetical protein